jgi:hypothetical protein
MTLRAAPLTCAGLLALACLNAWLLAIVVQSPAPEPAWLAPASTHDQPPGPPASEPSLPRPKPIATVEAINAMTARLHQAGRHIELQLYPKR